MKYATLVLAAVGLASAQVVSDYFPACAIPCFNNAITSASTCGVDDSWCICIRANYETISTAATPCVLSACGADVAIGEVIPAAGNYCNEATARHSASTASQTSAPSSSAPSSTSTPATTTAPPTTTAPSSTSPAPATTASPAAANANAGSLALVGVLALGALAL